MTVKRRIGGSSRERDKVTPTAQLMENRYHQSEHELRDILDTLKELLNEIEIQLIVDLNVNGYSYEDLCEKYGVTKNTYLENDGIESSKELEVNWDESLGTTGTGNLS